MIQYFYPMGFERKEGALLPSDLPEAINLFKESYGVDPEKVIVSQKMLKHFASIIPEGLELEVWGGCLKWEVGLIGGNSVKASPAKGAADTLPSRDETRQNTRLTPCKPLHAKSDGAGVLQHKVTHGKGRISKIGRDVSKVSVTKIIKTKVKVALSQPTKGIMQHGIMQHKRGRPLKAGKVHRATLWRRRQKENAKQGVLL